MKKIQFIFLTFVLMSVPFLAHAQVPNFTDCALNNVCVGHNSGEYFVDVVGIWLGAPDPVSEAEGIVGPTVGSWEGWANSWVLYGENTAQGAVNGLPGTLAGIESDAFGLQSEAWNLAMETVMNPYWPYDDYVWPIIAPTYNYEYHYAAGLVNQESGWALSEAGWATATAEGTVSSEVGSVMGIANSYVPLVAECIQSVDALATCIGAGQTVKDLNGAIFADAGSLDELALETADQAVAEAQKIETDLMESGLIPTITDIENIVPWITSAYITDDLYPALGSIYSETALFLNTTWTWLTGINQSPLPATLPPYPGGLNPLSSPTPPVSQPVPGAAAGVLR